MKLRNLVVTYYPQNKALALDICKFIKTHYKINARSYNIRNIKQQHNRPVDLVITVGGDGTFIKSASIFPTRMIVGIKAKKDSVGYHCTSDKKRYKGHIKAIMDGDFSTIQYFSLAAKVGNKKLPCAFNEVLIAPDAVGGMLEYSLSVGRKGFRGRGTSLIIYTPAGSTAHAKSAGGAQLSMDSDTVGIVPESQFTGNLRNLMVPSGSKISITSGNVGTIVIDGWYRLQIKANVRVIISKGREVEVVQFD
jgi:NAD+ kinase